MSDVQPAARQLVFQRPAVEAADAAADPPGAQQRQRVEIMHVLQLAIDQVQPVHQAVRADGIVMPPEALPLEPAQVLAEAKQAVRIEANDGQVPVRSQHALHLTQRRVRVLFEFQRMKGDQHVDAVAVERQLVGVTAQRYPIQLAAGDLQAVIDGTFFDEAEGWQRPHLHHVVTEGQVQYRPQALAQRVEQFFTAVTAIPAFQALANLVRLRVDGGLHAPESSEHRPSAQCRAPYRRNSMPTIEPIAAFSDNYIWLLHDADSTAHVVDPGDAAPVLKALDERGLSLATIILTHHHFDHVGGVQALQDATGCRVIGPQNPTIQSVDERLDDGDRVVVGSYHFEVLAVPGHTLDHIAYYQAADGGEKPILFCGDTLFAGGCGRIFEGDPPMMFQSLQRLAGLPEDTAVYCAHEYTLANLAFARAADPDNAALAERVRAAQATRERDEPTVPSNIALERQTNPFLRSAEAALRDGLAAAGHPTGDSPVTTFAALRAWKDNF